MTPDIPVNVPTRVPGNIITRTINNINMTPSPGLIVLPGLPTNAHQPGHLTQMSIQSTYLGFTENMRNNNTTATFNNIIKLKMSHKWINY